MTYEDERGVSGRLAADDGYGTPPESYGAQQYGPMTPDGRDERGEPGQDWQGAPAPEESGADPDEFEYWASAEAPAGIPSAGRPPAEVAAALDYGAGGAGRQWTGGLHAPLPAGENAYVDWIKGLGTADATQEEWANADPHDFDADGGASAEGWPDGGASAEGWPERGASAEGWSGGDADGPGGDGEPGVPARQGASAAERAADGDENWFEPKPRSETGEYDDGEQFAPAEQAGNASPPDEENWFEPKPRNDGPDYSRPAIAAQSVAPAFAPQPSPPQLSAPGADWPRSAAELDFVTPDQVAGNSGFGAVEYRGGEYRSADEQPTEYRGGGYEPGGYEPGGYDGFGGRGSREPEPGYPAPGYPGEYGSSEYGSSEYGDDRQGDYAASDYAGTGYQGGYGEAPEDGPARSLDEAATTTLMIGGARKTAEQRRKTRSYRPIAIAAGVVVAATVGVVGVALHDSSAQSANPGTPINTVAPTDPSTDTGSPAVLLPPPDDSATASPPPTMPTVAPTTGTRPVRTTGAPRPTQPHQNPPPPPPTHKPTPTPTHTPTPTPTTATPTITPTTPTPTPTGGDPTS